MEKNKKGEINEWDLESVVKTCKAIEQYRYIFARNRNFEIFVQLQVCWLFIPVKAEKNQIAEWKF